MDLLGAPDPRAVADLPPDLLDELLTVATEVAVACGRLVVDERPERVSVAATKTSAIDIVTVMDRRSEDLAHALLGARRPEDGVVGEEGLDRPGTSGITWLVDPIDGTVNYLYDNDEYAVSVAAVVGDARTEGAWFPVAGAVFNPVTGDLFTARRGGGARHGDRVLSPTPAAELARSLVGTGFAYDPAVRERQATAVARVLPRVRDIRRHGAASLDLCAVAAGRLDAYYEENLNAWDIAAAWVVVEESCLAVRGPGGGRPRRRLTLAGRPDVLDRLEDLVSD
ncbi:inositol monophosphatase [Propioniciclava sp. MC1683]|uniref:inositol monophosphatase family protein n=1 Tax=Propioniciclava sp. MC1683 TaxID=2760309 RepID=UPI0016023002|nr:inositol monophosphatase family protein [Propioniciclava sp. MC1683]MBB1501232.1 inositol monophosphatase [Propioniciclava sp. MC1683]